MESILDIIYVPLAWIFKLCYLLVNNYGLAILLFAIVAKLLMLPLGIKSEKGRLKTQSMQPKLNALQQKFHGDTKNPKYNEELQALYKQEGYNPLSGCLPSLIQLPVILGLWNAIRQPLTYIVGLNADTKFAIVRFLNSLGVKNIVTAVESAKLDLTGSEASRKAVMAWLKTNEVKVAQALSDDGIFAYVKDGLTQASTASGNTRNIMTEISQLNLKFLGLDLGMTPSEYIADAGSIFVWALLLPILAGASSFLVSFITQKYNAVPSPDGKKNGLNLMLYMMPLLSVWFSFSFQTGIGIYWIFSNLLSIGQVFLLKALIKPPKEAEGPVKEKKLNYNQIEKLKREERERENEDAIIVPEEQTEPEADPFAKFDNPENTGKK